MAYVPNFPSKEYFDRCIILPGKESETPENAARILEKYGKKKFETFDEFGRPRTGWTIAIFDDRIKRLCPGIYDPTMWEKSANKTVPISFATKRPRQVLPD